MTSIKSLRAFVFIMEQGSLTGAADKLNLSQPAVSRLLQQLELDFGRPLFFRDSKTLTPSKEAKLLFPEAQRILRSYDEVPKIFETLKAAEAPPFKVLCHPRCVPGLVAPALARLHVIFPDLRIDLDIFNRLELGRRIIRDRFDVGIFTIPMQVDIAEIKYKRSSRFDVVLDRSHPLADRAVLHSNDLKGESFIAQTAGLISRQLIEDALAKAGADLPIVHEVTTSQAALNLVKHGVGFTIADRLSVGPEFASDLAIIPFEPRAEIEYAFCFAKDARRHEMRDIFLVLLDDIIHEIYG
ncbi:MAG: LysR family transcriptional regulator [Pseudomonadota bacterium]